MASLLLSGWAQPADALRLLDAEAHAFDYSAYIPGAETLGALEKWRDAESVIAWSTGGQLALSAIAAGVLAPKHLTLIGTPLQFVTGGDIRGMDPLTFEQFRNNYASNPARTKTRFHALVAKGDHAASRILAALQHHEDVDNTARWLPWLTHLGNTRLDPQGLLKTPSTLVIHGEADAIVPATQAGLLGKLLPHAHVQLWPHVGHAPHVNDPARLQATIAAHRVGAL